MDMEDEFGMMDYKGLIMNGGRSHNFIKTPAAIDQHRHPVDFQFFSSHCDLTTKATNDREDARTMTVGFSEFPSDGATIEANATVDETGLLGVDGGSGDGHNERWRRQETLILLEIRSRLDSQFKEATQKGPLWDQVSRIMFEEHAYQRSGKKCREKFENMYKYYKKTKESGNGRRLQHANQYRFFSQFDAICGDSSNAGFSVRSPESCIYAGNRSLQLQCPSSTPRYLSQKPHGEGLEITEDLFRTSGLIMKDVDSGEKRRRIGERSWKEKIKGFIDLQIKRLIEKQEAWLEKLMKTIEQKEKERILREEEWRKQEELRIDKEHSLWEEERSWIEARDVALLELLHKLTDDGRETLNDHNTTKAFACKGKCESFHHNNHLCCKKRRQEITNNGFLHNCGGGLWQINEADQQETGKLQASDRPSLESSNSFRLVMDETESLIWETYRVPN